MADITSRQNDEQSIRLLRAQRQLYAQAKQFSAFQVVLAVATPIVAAIVVAVRPQAAVWAALAGIIASFINTVFDFLQQQRRRDAALAQQGFDCYVLELPWNEAVAGRPLAPEDIHEAVTNFKPQTTAPLENWYPAAVKDVPISEGRLICQRTNCWWDSKLRRRYATYIVLTVAVIGAFVLGLGIATGLTVEKLVLAVLAPLSPTILWAMREVRRQHDAATALDRLKGYGESLWRRMLGDTLSEAEMLRLSRELQDAIFYRRRENPFVFDWVYRRLRKTFEDQMNVGAEAMVNEIRSERRL